MGARRSRRWSASRAAEERGTGTRDGVAGRGRRTRHGDGRKSEKQGEGGRGEREKVEGVGE